MTWEGGGVVEWGGRGGPGVFYVQVYPSLCGK